MYKDVWHGEHFWLWESDKISVIPDGKITLIINNIDQKQPMIEIECTYKIMIHDDKLGSVLLTDDTMITRIGQDIIEQELISEIMKCYKEKPWKFNWEKVLEDERDRFDD